MEPDRPFADRLPPTRFPAHGEVRYEVVGACLVGEARGPFNLELVGQMQRQLLPLLPGLRAQGPWDHLCRFHESALTSPEALAALGRLLAELAAAGLTPQRTAYVMGEPVEGAHLMAPLFERGFAAAGLVCKCFANEAEARAWLQR